MQSAQVSWGPLMCKESSLDTVATTVAAATGITIPGPQQACGNVLCSKPPKPFWTKLTAYLRGCGGFIPDLCLPGRQVLPTSKLPPLMHSLYLHRQEQAASSIESYCTPLPSIVPLHWRGPDPSQTGYHSIAVCVWPHVSHGRDPKMALAQLMQFMWCWRSENLI